MNEYHRLFDEEVVKNKLIISSIYINVFEVFKKNLINRHRNFLFSDFKSIKEYQNAQKEINKNDLANAFEFYLKCGGMTEDDVSQFKTLRAIRNEITHEGVDFLLKNNNLDLIENLKLMIQLFEKIEIWCIREILISGDSYYDNQIIEDKDIKSLILEYVKFLNLLIIKDLKN